MLEEQQTNVSGEMVDDNTQDYLTALKELKQNSVDRSKYDQLKAENKRLIDSIVNGQEINVGAKEEEVDINGLRDDLFNHQLSNLEYVTKSLQLRNELIKSGEPDPFLPIGKQILPTDEDIKCANRVAQVLQECIDYAEGDSQVFTNELNRRLVDVKIR